MMKELSNIYCLVLSSLTFLPVVLYRSRLTSEITLWPCTVGYFEAQILGSIV